MAKKMTTFTLSSTARNDFLDITHHVEKACKDANLTDGIVVVFIPHTTAGVTINENADPDVCLDFYKELDDIVPWNNNYAHYEGNTAAHIKASMMGSSVTVIVEDGRLVLGTWQGIYFAEFDGPRKRKVHVKCME